MATENPSDEFLDDKPVPFDELVGIKADSLIQIKKGRFVGVNKITDTTGEDEFEKVEFINKILKQIWPEMTVLLKKLVKKLEPYVEKLNLFAGFSLDVINSIGTFKFKSIILGNKCPIIHGIRVLNKPLSENELLLEIDFAYFSNAEILFAIAGIMFNLFDIDAGVKNISAKGKVLIGIKYKETFPFVTSFFATCMKAPKIDFELTQSLVIFDLPGLNGFAKDVAEKQVQDFLVFPNKIDFVVNIKESCENTM